MAILESATIGSIVSAAMALAGTTVSAGISGGISTNNKKIAAENLAFQKAQWEYNKQQDAYNKQLQLKQWQREDTAVSRRMADYQNAGLSRLFAGSDSASSTSSPVSYIDNAPQRDKQEQIDLSYLKDLNLAEIFMNITKMKEDISLTREEEKRVKAERERLENDNKWYAERGIPTNYQQSDIEKIITTLGDIFGTKDKSTSGVINAFRDWASSVTQGAKLDKTTQSDTKFTGKFEPYRAKGGGWIVNGIWFKTQDEVRRYARSLGIKSYKYNWFGKK